MHLIIVYLALGISSVVAGQSIRHPILPRGDTPKRINSPKRNDSPKRNANPKTQAEILHNNIGVPIHRVPSTSAPKRQVTGVTHIDGPGTMHRRLGSKGEKLELLPVNEPHELHSKDKVSVHTGGRALKGTNLAVGVSGDVAAAEVDTTKGGHGWVTKEVPGFRTENDYIGPGQKWKMPMSAVAPNSKTEVGIKGGVTGDAIIAASALKLQPGENRQDYLNQDY